MEGVHINVRGDEVKEGRIKNTREQRVKSGGKWQSVFKTLISSLLAVAALKYQGKSKDPFEAKPIVIWCFLLSFILYSLTIILGLLKNYCSAIFSRMALAFGALSMLSLISLFLPPTY
ncbi:hypothetical protein HAX54_006462 [Datura stramonium]|uniref:Uncharacterized protein n=1 Tax=Datura stramonium TaxID=4076 RepID=A0ABS8TAB7_DATST|nr:hypothetical protein [Datura stramonium]